MIQLSNDKDLLANPGRLTDYPELLLPLSRQVSVISDQVKFPSNRACIKVTQLVA
jgi:hypothetical protein